VLRRWQAAHPRWPRTLMAAARDAGMKAVPIDPYDGKPLRLVMLDGEPVVYSVGRDGKDDGGQKDSKLDTQAGDLLYRLPVVENRREIRPTHYRLKQEDSSGLTRVRPRQPGHRLAHFPQAAGCGIVEG
jgi:hypothetical protein